MVVLFPVLDNLLFWSKPTETENALVRLGNPLASDGHSGRALNVWDLKAFDDKIYVAGGSTVENSGPINIWAYNPATQQFEQEGNVNEEAIELFRIFDEQLYIPAADAIEGDSHKFYRRNVDGNWQLLQSTSVELAHVRDLIKLDTGKVLLVGNNRHTKDLSKPAMAVTDDYGQTFQKAGIENPPDEEFNWFFSVFPYQGKIYAPTSLLKDSANESGTIAVFNPETNAFELDPTLSNSEFIPQSHFEQQGGKQGFYVIYRPWHPIEYKDALVYPARSYSYYDENYKQAYMNSIGFYVKPAPGVAPFEVSFPDGKSVGEDVLVIDEALYVVANRKIANNKFVVYVYKTDNPVEPGRWQEVLKFKSRNRVRAFEYLDGNFYFGLGQNYDEPIGKSGEILSLQTNL
ncbi:MAG: hypothetical protein AAGA46_05210 [Cyanobacteria bacterium P01_F01_bin.13]